MHAIDSKSRAAATGFIVALAFATSIVGVARAADTPVPPPATPAAPDRSIVNELIVDAPVADVWAKFTTKEGCASWMAPRAEVDFRVGGTIRTNYDVNAKA